MGGKFNLPYVYNQSDMPKYKFILKIATQNIGCLSDYFCGGHKLNYDYKFVAPLRKTRDAFPAAKIHKEVLRKVFNVWTKSHINNFCMG